MVRLDSQDSWAHQALLGLLANQDPWALPAAQELTEPLGRLVDLDPQDSSAIQV